MRWLSNNWWWIVLIVCIYVLGAGVGWEIKEGLK